MSQESALPLEYVESYLRAHHVVVVSSINSSSGELWSWPVYYVYVRGRLLFASNMTSRHVSDIGVRARVSFVVTETDQRPPISAHAIQAVGIARPATFKEYSLFVSHYAPTFAKYGSNMLSSVKMKNSLNDALATRPYVVEPVYAKLTDKRYRQEPVEVEFTRVEE